MAKAGSGAPANENLNRNAPFGGPDGQGPVLVALLMRTLIEMPSFEAQMARGRFWCPCYTSLNRNGTICEHTWPRTVSKKALSKPMTQKKPP